jgi:hypothetical protein
MTYEYRSSTVIYLEILYCITRSTKPDSVTLYLFNDAVGTSHSIASNGMMITEQMIEKYVKGTII